MATLSRTTVIADACPALLNIVDILYLQARVGDLSPVSHFVLRLPLPSSYSPLYLKSLHSDSLSLSLQGWPRTLLCQHFSHPSVQVVVWPWRFRLARDSLNWTSENEKVQCLPEAQEVIQQQLLLVSIPSRQYIVHLGQQNCAVWYYMIHLPKPTECITAIGNRNANYGLWAIMI